MDQSSVSPDTGKVPILINRDYALLAMGQGISFIGDAFFTTSAILWIATQLAYGEAWAPAAVGVLALVQVLPQVIVGPLAGVFVDRRPKKAMMLAMDAARAALLALLIVLSAVGNGDLPLLTDLHLSKVVVLGALYATVFFITCCSQFFGPARLALVGDIVPDQLRPRASGVAQMIAATAGIVGPAVAAPLFFLVGPGGALGIDALSFLVSFCAILAVHAPAPLRKAAREKTSRFIDELLDGFRVVRTNKVLVTVLVTGVIFMLGGGALNTLSIFFIQQNLHASPELFGLLGAVEGIGALAGGLLAAVFAERIGVNRLFWLMAMLFGLATIVYSRLTSLAPGLALIFVIGLIFASLEVAEAPLILRNAPKEYVGRVVAILIPSYSVASTVSTLVAGWLASTLLRDFHASLLGITLGPIDTIFATAGVLAALAGLLAMVRLRGAHPQGVEAPAASEPALR
jgi:MFS family permease